ncbi:hypothetical protein [Clostridium mediterraneense]|uniref:hypothetical protein n=1 Tax=Clostridium mediterraneense TaxID=1805472 RepID=UPI00082F3AEF|nr:hypothetical protein [Clostridium mediterraneense]
MSRDSKVEDLKEYIEDEELATRAINIDAIAVDELESNFLLSEIDTDEVVENEKMNFSKYNEYEKEILELDEEEYLDAFENVEYLADIEDLDEFDLDDSTEELFPGVRILKKKD